MIILFAPSEGKREGGDLPPINQESFIFPELYSKRYEVIEQYERFKREGSEAELSELFGIKDSKEHERYKVLFENAPAMKAMLRYDGVAYDYLRYPELSESAQHYIDRNVIVFSNLFGPVLAGDRLPDYKLKQGSSIGSFVPDKFYKRHFTQALDQMIGDKEILDLRAGFYDKFYAPSKPATTMKFLKDGKTVSHWAKAYRGTLLRAVAMNEIETIDELLAMPVEGLQFKEIHKTAKKYEIIYNIL